MDNNYISIDLVIPRGSDIWVIGNLLVHNTDPISKEDNLLKILNWLRIDPNKRNLYCGWIPNDNGLEFSRFGRTICRLSSDSLEDTETKYLNDLAEKLKNE